MADIHSRKDIEKISLEILRGSKSLDTFPTSVEKIVQYSELIVRNDIDVSKIDPGYLTKAGNLLGRALSKIRGFLDRREKTIYLDLSQGTSRKNFIKLHEVGHDVLPWQRDIHDVLADDDESLNLDYKEEFEAEANYFASITLFQHDRFVNELNKLNLSMDSAMYLAKHFGASVHAALRRYIDCSKNKCALIVLEKISPKGTIPQCFLRNLFYSERFDAHFGTLEIPATLDYSFDFVRDYYNGRKYKQDGFTSLITKNGNVDFTYHFFNNTYNAFVFLFPVGEKKSSRTKIIITEPFQ